MIACEPVADQFDLKLLDVVQKRARCCKSFCDPNRVPKSFVHMHLFYSFYDCAIDNNAMGSFTAALEPGRVQIFQILDHFKSSNVEVHYK